MSEFSDVLSNTYGDLRQRMVDRAVAPYEMEVMRQWRASHAAPAVAELAPAATVVEEVPAAVVPAPRPEVAEAFAQVR